MQHQASSDSSFPFISIKRINITQVIIHQIFPDAFPPELPRFLGPRITKFIMRIVGIVS